jgi:CPA2 family monovalent cation:H+ antiporter-2
MEPTLLTDIVVLLGVSLGVLYLAHHVRLPPVVAFLVTGVVLGPEALGVVRAVHEVEQLAEIGVILVLFTVGLELSIKDLLRIRRTVLVGGTVQMAVVIGGVYAALSALGMTQREALFLGLIASLSSTAVVLRILQQRADMDSAHGRTSVAVLVYQDLAIVPMMLLVPVLAGGGGSVVNALGGFALKAVGILALVLFLARVVVPQLLQRVVGTRSRDMFLLAVVTTCLAVAWVASTAGLSLALGAFLAGLIVSESEYSHQALADILPFRDLFSSFFFISIGMLLDVRLVAQAPLLLTALVAGLLVLKAGAGAVATLAVGLSVRTAALTGMALAQVGEFSFILAGSGVREGVIGAVPYQWFLAAAVASIGATPFLISAGPRVAQALDRLPLPPRLRFGGLSATVPGDPAGRAPPSDHVVVVGYGLNGGNVARAAAMAAIPFVVVEMNPATVREERARGVPIHYGDATQAAVLERAGVPGARVVIVAISDAAATRRVTALARGLSPACRIIARTRYLHEVEPLRAAGADLVIPEELETSLEIVARVLASYLVSKPEIDSFLTEVRAGGYDMLRAPSTAGPTLADLQPRLADIQISTLRLEEGSPLAGKKLGDTDLRRLFGVTVVAIRRGEAFLPNPGAEARLQPDDALIVMGLNEEIASAVSLFRAEGLDPSGPE